MALLILHRRDFHAANRENFANNGPRIADLNSDNLNDKGQLVTPLPPTLHGSVVTGNLSAIRVSLRPLEAVSDTTSWRFQAA